VGGGMEGEKDVGKSYVLKIDNVFEADYREDSMVVCDHRKIFLILVVAGVLGRR
jgi:hypothetical protein